MDYCERRGVLTLYIDILERMELAECYSNSPLGPGLRTPESGDGKLGQSGNRFAPKGSLVPPDGPVGLQMKLR